jgi:hypothetical protein
LPTVRPTRKRQPHSVIVRDGWTLVILDDKAQDWIEVRPHNQARIGPCLDMYRVNGPEPVHLVRLRVTSVLELIKFLPTAINAAFRAKPQDQ